ncbi:MAG TPA: hypothetical protein GXX38_05025 [Clostridia bacterium]|nr:hypothetical protein [Clostridia bacterium]
MQIKGIRIGVVVIVTLFILGSLLLAQYIWETRGIYKPLLQSVESVEGVNTVTIEKEKKNLVIKIELEPVNNFALIYKEIEDIINNRLAEDSYQIKIKDKRNEILTSSFLSLSSFIQEGIQTGRYSLMEEQIKNKASSLELDHVNVLVDAENIYLQLHSGENYLYEVIPRK